VIRCRALGDYNESFVQEVEKELKLKIKSELQKKVVNNIVSDLRSYLIY